MQTKDCDPPGFTCPNLHNSELQKKYTRIKNAGGLEYSLGSVGHQINNEKHKSGKYILCHGRNNIKASNKIECK